MKSFREFILEAIATGKGKKPPRMPGENVVDYVKRTRGVDVSGHTDLSPDDNVRKYVKNAKVSKDIFNNQTQSSSKTPNPSATPKTSAIVKSGPSALSTIVKPPTIKVPINTNVPGKPKIPGLKSGAGIGAVLSTADEKMKGSGNLRSLAKGATVAAGTVLGGLAGGAAGTAVAPGAGTAIGGFAGQSAGAEIAGKAFDTVAGKNAVQRAADREANRKRQSGGE